VQAHVVIERGILNELLLNSYTARKLGLNNDGNAARGITGNAGVGPGNFIASRAPKRKSSHRRSEQRIVRHGI